MFHKALKDAGKLTKLVYYGERDLGHAFVGTCPELEQSQDAIDKMLSWFEEQADIQREEELRAAKEKAGVNNAEISDESADAGDAETAGPPKKKTAAGKKSEGKKASPGRRKKTTAE